MGDAVPGFAKNVVACDEVGDKKGAELKPEAVGQLVEQVGNVVKCDKGEEDRQRYDNAVAFLALFFREALGPGDSLSEKG